MPSTNEAMPDRLRMETGLLFLAAVKRFAREDDLRGAIALVGGPDMVPRRSRKAAGRRIPIPMIGAAAIARALLASNLSGADAALCLDAMIDGGSPVKSPFLPDFVRLARVALDAYDAGSQSFDLDGIVVHALRPR